MHVYLLNAGETTELYLNFLFNYNDLVILKKIKIYLTIVVLHNIFTAVIIPREHTYNTNISS